MTRKRRHDARPVGRPRTRQKPERPLAEALGRRIRRRREALGLTTEEACARTAGVLTVPTWAGYEGGWREPRAVNLLALCRALEWRPDLIFPPEVLRALKARDWPALETFLTTPTQGDQP